MPSFLLSLLVIDFLNLFIANKQVGVFIVQTLMIYYYNSRELDQWLKKMKYVGSNVGLEQYKDIKVI